MGMKKVLVSFLLYLICFVAGIVCSWFLLNQPTPRLYGVVEKDIQLDYLGIQNEPISGVIKSGSIVTTGNLLKGGNASFQIGGWVPKEHIRIIGRHNKLLNFVRTDERK